MFKKLFIFVFLFSLFFNIKSVFAMGTNYNDLSSQSESKEVHGQSLGNTGTSDRAFIEISFFVTDTTRLVKSTGAVGFNLQCYYNSAWNSCGSITPINTQIIKVSDGSTVSCSDPCTGLNASEVYKVRYYRASSMNLPANADVYFYYNIGDTYNYKMLGTTAGTGGRSGDYGSNYQALTDSTGIGSFGTCWGNITNCGISPLPNPTNLTTEEDINYLEEYYTVSGSGDFGVTGVGYHAIIQFQRTCSDSIETTLDGTSTKVEFYADNPKTTTVMLDESNYLGTGYTTTNSTYAYEGVRLPLKNGFNCTYIPVVRIFDESDPNNIQPVELENDGNSDPYSQVLDEYVPPTNSPNTPFIGNEPNAYFCDTFEISCYYSQFISFFKGFFNSTFNPSPIIPAFRRNLGYLQQLVYTKAPFGYFATAYGADLTTPTTTENIPNFTYKLASVGSYSQQDYVVDFPTEMDTILNSLRFFINIVIWLLFFGYIVIVARRLYK